MFEKVKVFSYLYNIKYYMILIDMDIASYFSSVFSSYSPCSVYTYSKEGVLYIIDWM